MISKTQAKSSHARVVCGHLLTDMKNADIVNVFCKLFGLYFAIQVLVNVKDTILFGVINELYDNKAPDFYYFLGGQFSNMLFNSIAAWFLISKTDLVVRKLIVHSDKKLDFNVTKTDLIELAIIGVSLIIMMDAIPELLHKVVSYIYFNPYDKNEKELFWTNKTRGDIFYFSCKFVVGLITILNYRFIAKTLIRIGVEDDKKDVNE